MSAWGDVRPAPPVAWYLHQDGTGQFNARGEHCQQPQCHGPIEVVSHRGFRQHGRVLRAEHFWCKQHGQEFAARWGIEVDGRSERSAWYLPAAEAAALAATGRECEHPACHRRPACVLLERFVLRGEPARTERLFCGEHGWFMSVRWHIKIQGTAPEGGSR